MNYGACNVCPIGVRYFPQHHLRQALATGRCRLHTNATVRRIVPQGERAISILLREGNSSRETEIHADAVIVAAGPIETARLLLLSKAPAFPDGLGNHAGHLGKHFFMHHTNRLHVDVKPFLFNGRSQTGAAVSHQFLTSTERGRVGGFALNVGHETYWPAHTKHDWLGGDRTASMTEWVTGKEVVEEAREAPHCQFLGYDVEVMPGDGKYIALSDQTDRFGDAFASVHYDFDEFDHATLAAGNAMIERIAHLIDGQITSKLPKVPRSGHHHHGGARMSVDPRDGVVDPLGRVHGIRNLLVLGGATFPSFSAANPTLTMVAHAIRSCEALLEQLK
jgi:choline dehydrogenase-like flavoprotein